MSPIKAQVIISGLAIIVVYGQSNSDAIQKYQDQIGANPKGSLAHYQLGEAFFQQKNYMQASNEFREALNGDLQPRWVEVWSHLRLGSIFHVTGQHDRAANEYRQAIRTGDDTGGAQDLAADYLKRQPSKPEDPARTAPAAFRIHMTASGPEPVRKTDPEYSEEARAAGLEGTAFVETAISADGSPFDLHVKSSLGLGLDEQAMDAVEQWRFTPLPAQSSSQIVAVDFLLPSKLSRWHLVGASFESAEGVSRPTFLTEPYPLGAGISEKAIDEGAVISAIRRPANVTLQFDIDSHGVPTNFQILAASAPVWGNEAIAVVRNWRFTPGTKDGNPVSVSCTLDLVWGQKVWTPATLAQLREKMGGPKPGKPGPPPANATISAPYIIDDSTPHWPYSVVASVVIGEDGEPTSVRLVRSFTPDYDSQALEAVRKWRFQPTLVNGTPTPLPALIEVDFTPP